MKKEWWEMDGCLIASNKIHQPTNAFDIYIGRTHPSEYEQRILKSWSLMCVYCKKIYKVQLLTTREFVPGDVG